MGKLFNNNNLKLSYCCTRNIQGIITAHNRKLLQQTDNVVETKKCNCRGGVVNCPVGGACLEEEVVYEATVTVEGKPDMTRSYIGSASTSMKTRLNNHRCDFNNRNREHATTLSSYVWKTKDQDLAPVVKYKIVGRAKAYSPVSGKCRLCTLEKLFIAKSDEMVGLNMRSEISGKCRHRNRHVLSAKLDKG